MLLTLRRKAQLTAIVYHGLFPVPPQLFIASIALFLGEGGGEGPWDEASSDSVSGAICKT